MRLAHLALAVRDQDRSRRFYETYFGFGVGPSQRYEDGVLIIRDAEGFDLALGETRGMGELPPFVHFGFRCAEPDDVRALLERVMTDGVSVVERFDEPDFVSFKCLDPDGYIVEVYWE
jgi:catechol 2,3-dioxygenase-like lactoylglutathione lyase family enzyme